MAFQALAAVQAGLGIGQLVKRLFSKNPDKAKLGTTQGTKEAIQVGQQLATAERPGSADARQNIDQGVSNVAAEVAKVTGDSNKIISSVNAANTSANNARVKESALDANFNIQGKQALLGALRRKSLEELQSRRIEERRGERQDANLAAFAEGGIQNIVGALDTVQANQIEFGGIIPTVNKVASKVPGTIDSGIGNPNIDAKTKKQLAALIKKLGITS